MPPAACRPLLFAIFLAFAGGCGDDGRRWDAFTEWDAAPHDLAEEGDLPFEGTGCPGSDRDEDTIPDWVEGEQDTDGDTIPNADDEDSDGDTILDRHEAGDFDCNTPPVDSDSDGTPDYLDLDSDDDTIPDAEEAGDDDPSSYPRDTDRWGAPDYRDIDSDNDGLSDAQEKGLGTDPYKDDTDGDGDKDMEELASSGGDPRDPSKGVSESEDIFTLWYDGRSQYQIYTARAHYEKNDVLFVVDVTYGNAAAAGALRDAWDGEIAPALELAVDGLAAGLEIYSGWTPGGTGLPEACTYPLWGMARLTGDRAAVAGAVAAIPFCPEPLDGSSLVSALASAASVSGASGWPEAAGTCPRPAAEAGNGCFRPDARAFVFLLHQGAFPDSTPAGAEEPLTLAEASGLLAERGVHVVGLLAQDDASSPPFADVAGIARETGATDRMMRPFVYAAGRRGERLAAAVQAALADIGRNLPADVALGKDDGPDWPEGVDINGDGTPDDFDATQLVSFVQPRGWSPAPGVAPDEAVLRIDGTTYVQTLPDTELSYRVYFRNYDIAQQRIGRIFSLELSLRNERGYVYRAWPVRVIVPCLTGDS